MNRFRPAILLLVTALTIAGSAAAPAAAETIAKNRRASSLTVPITIEGNRASLSVTLGGVRYDIAVQFEQVTNLSAANLGITARLAPAAELIGRLPAGVDAALPLVIAIEPPAGGGLAFDGLAYVYIHTHSLHYTPGSPLRIYSAPLGGAFADITETTGVGSYRACGSKGGFSEFLIVGDNRALDDVIAEKLATVDALLAASGAAIPDDVEATLQTQLDATQLAWEAADYVGAALAIESFAATVKTAADAGTVPNRWRSARDLVNVAGNLRAAAGTLRYSLVLGE